MKKKLLLSILISGSLLITQSKAQMVVLGSFDPTSASDLCGIGYEPDSSHVWIYGCNETMIQCFTPAGTWLYSFPVAGGTANDVDIEIAPSTLVLNGQTFSEGQLLFINGEVGQANIFAMDNVSGSVLDTLIAGFGASHVVGGSYHPDRNTFFLVQDNVPGTALENLIGEIDPLTGDTIQTFHIGAYFNVSYGDLEIGANGNLFVVSSVEDSVAEFTPQGVFVMAYALPSGVTDISGIALDCANSEAWLSSTSGTVYHIGQFPCFGVSGVEDLNTNRFSIDNISPNPFSSELNFTMNLKQSDEIKLTITNVLGEEVKYIYNGKINDNMKFTVDLKELSGGLYMLNAIGSSYKISKRIIALD